jgi:hypothetical protein
MKTQTLKKTKGEQTVDGNIFESDKEYWFYDADTKSVRSNIGLRADGEHLYSFGWKVIRIDELRERKKGAIADGRKRLSDDIKKIREIMASLQSEQN